MSLEVDEVNLISYVVMLHSYLKLSNRIDNKVGESVRRTQCPLLQDKSWDWR